MDSVSERYTNYEDLIPPSIDIKEITILLFVDN